MTTGVHLGALRKQKGLTLGELSALSGVSRDDLGQYERGVMTPRPETVQKIAAALDVPIAAIRDGCGWTAPERTEGWESAGGDRLLREGIAENLREAYGPGFALKEDDLRALLASVKASIPALIEHMKDTRPEPEINREILSSLQAEDAGEEPACPYVLMDGQWEALRPLFPPENGGRGRAFKSNRLMLEGILFWMTSGVSWTELPERFGRPRCVADRLRLWSESGLWPQVLRRLLEMEIVEKESVPMEFRGCLDENGPG